MIAMQNPRASVVGGFRQWLKAGRAVRKGEAGACIWIPLHSANGQAETPAAEGQDGEPMDGSKTGFGLATVFDVTQTDEKGAE
jgi:antirestriction protein ArdC